MPVQQHHPGRGDVQRQAQQGGGQQNGGEYREIQGPQRIDADQQHHDRQGDAEGEEHIEEKGRNRQHDHAQHDQQQQRYAQIALLQPRQVAAHITDHLRTIYCHCPTPADSIF
jgi:hypothetical protein